MEGWKRAITIALLWMGVVLPAGPLQAQPYAEAYNFGPGYVPAFAKKTNGPDMLPLTADDGTAVLNLAGSLSCDVIDLNGDLGGLNLDFSFHNRKFDDDEQLSFTAHSEFGLGIIAEGENWCDMRQDDGLGATGSGPDGSTQSWHASGRNWDWETNDSSSPGYAGWESGSDYLWFNNAAANQRGLGGSKYYFEYKNPDQHPGITIFDEPEKYRRANKLSHVWAENPGNGDRNNYFGWDFNIEIRGFLIPTSAIHSLPHGSLHPLFGWQSIDMADYVRETLGAYLDANGNPINGLEVWDPDEGGYNGGNNPPPYKYVYIFQTKDVYQKGPPGNNVDAAAAHYGMTEGVSGTRRTHIVFRGDVEPAIDIAPPAPGPGEPAIANSWGRDDMIRNNYTNGPAPGFTAFGNLQPGGTDLWVLDTDPGSQDSRVVRLGPGTAAADAWIKLPTLQLPARHLGVVVGKATLRLEAGTSEANEIQIALVNGDSAVASGGFKVGRPATVGVGGTVADGPVTGSVGIPEPPTPDANGDGVVDGNDYAVFVGCATGPHIPMADAGCVDLDLDLDADIDQDDFGVFQRCFSGTSPFDPECAPIAGTKVNPGANYIDLALWYDASAGTVRLTMNGEELASYTADSPTGAYVDGLYVWTGSAESLTIDTLGVYSGMFTCSANGDFNGDGEVDSADEAAAKACYSGPGVPYRTGIFPSCACLDADGDYDVDEDDGVTP